MKKKKNNSKWFSHGSGKVRLKDFASVGSGVVFEPGVLVIHPESIKIGNDVYVGHYAILHGYHKNQMILGDGTWIGQMCYFHSAGGIEIGRDVGIGPGVKILTSYHDIESPGQTIIKGGISLGKVIIGDGCDIGVGAIILPRVKIGQGAQVGAGAVVTQDVPDFSIVAGVPARVLRFRQRK